MPIFGVVGARIDRAKSCQWAKSVNPQISDEFAINSLQHEKVNPVQQTSLRTPHHNKSQLSQRC